MATFETKILTAGKTATGICIPEEIIEKLGAGKKPPIRVTLNGYTYRGTVAVMGGKFMVSVSSDVRKAANVSGGDTLTVDVELDLEKREVSLPSDFKTALNENLNAKKFFELLSYSKQKNYITIIEQAKTVETRVRRIEKSIEDLSSNKK